MLFCIHMSVGFLFNTKTYIQHNGELIWKMNGPYSPEFACQFKNKNKNIFQMVIYWIVFIFGLENAYAYVLIHLLKLKQTIPLIFLLYLFLGLSVPSIRIFCFSVQWSIICSFCLCSLFRCRFSFLSRLRFKIISCLRCLFILRYCFWCRDTFIFGFARVEEEIRCKNDNGSDHDDTSGYGKFFSWQVHLLFGLLFYWVFGTNMWTSMWTMLLEGSTAIWLVRWFSLIGPFFFWFQIFRIFRGRPVLSIWKSWHISLQLANKLKLHVFEVIFCCIVLEINFDLLDLFEKWMIFKLISV